MRSLTLLFLTAGAAMNCSAANADDKMFSPKLRIAFSSYRRTPRQPKIYFYDHDGVSKGKIVGTIETANKESDSHVSLANGGRLCAFAHELENNVSQVFLWSRDTKQYLDLPNLNISPNSQLCPSLSGDGRWLVFAAWSRPGANQRWDVLLYDVQQEKTVPLPGMNTQYHDERTPALSGDGRWIAFTSNAKQPVRAGGQSPADIVFYDRKADRVLRLPRLNSPSRDVDPSLSGDGNLIAFSSDRFGGKGGRDIYLYDRRQEEFLPLLGLNAVAHEQSPSLTSNGRYIAFVSERISGEGERDIFLYDRQTSRLLPTPALNAPQEDFDPCVITLPARE